MTGCIAALMLRPDNRFGSPCGGKCRSGRLPVCGILPSRKAGGFPLSAVRTGLQRGMKEVREATILSCGGFGEAFIRRNICCYRKIAYICYATSHITPVQFFKKDNIKPFGWGLRGLEKSPFSTMPALVSTP